MSLALFIAILAILLYGMSQYQRRAKVVPSWLPLFTRLLAVAILVLAAFYFFDRFVA